MREPEGRRGQYRRCVLVSAALVPQTALLVPGAAGRSEVLVDQRRAVGEATRSLLAAAPDRVVVVAPGNALDLTGRLHPTLAAAGLDDDLLGWPSVVLGVGAAPDDEPTAVDDVGAAVGLHLLARAGWAGPVGVLGVPVTDGLLAQGRALVDGPERVALLLCASLSARRGPGSPLAEDDRAPALDDAVLADLAGLGAAPREALDAWNRLAEVPAELATALAVSAWAPWRVLLGALGDDPVLPVRVDVVEVSVPLGATYAVLVWRRRDEVG